MIYLAADCTIQALLALGCVVASVVVLRNLKKKGGLGRNAVTLTVVFSLLSCVCFFINRVVMLAKGLTPEWFDVCCYFVLSDPRKHHRLRWVELLFLLIAVYFALFALSQIALSWLEIALATVRMSGKSSVIVKKLRMFYWCLEAVAGFVYVVLIFVNIGFASVLAIAAYLLLAGSYIYAERMIYPILSTASMEGNDISRHIEYTTLQRQIRITTYGILGMGLVTIGGAGLYFYTNLAGNHDWKDFSPPGKISINYVGNSLISLGWLLMLSFVVWFLHVRTAASKLAFGSTKKRDATKFSHTFEPTRHIIHDI